MNEIVLGEFVNTYNLILIIFKTWKLNVDSFSAREFAYYTHSTKKEINQPNLEQKDFTLISQTLIFVTIFYH